MACGLYLNVYALRACRAVRGLTVFCVAVTLVLLVSCVEADDYSNTCRDNTEALWKIMDEHYCFFAEKRQQLGVDWGDVRRRYLANVSDNMSRTQLFEFLGNMIGELRDGHVNLTATFDYARNWSWKEDYPDNYSDALLRCYLGTDYRITSGMYYRILDDNVGYIYVGSFADEMGDGNIDEALLYLSACQGLIVDVRNNGGGMLTEAQRLAARFCNENTFVGYMQHKTGPGHDDFSAMEEQWLSPSAGIRWQKKVCVLTNRSVYSAANEFVKYMHRMPRVTIVGDTTGGGSGMPYSAELPNGWGVRFSACPMYDAEGNSTEHGIAPDIVVGITESDMLSGIDTIIEAARRILYR